MTKDELKTKCVELWEQQHTIGFIVQELRISPTTIIKYVLRNKAPNQIQNWNEAQDLYDELQEKGDTYFKG